MRIGKKLILGFVTIALLIWAVGYLAINTSRKALQKSIGESSISLAAQILDNIDRALYNKIERVQSFGDPSLRKTITKSNQEFQSLDNIQNYINQKDREWTSVPKGRITPFMKDLIDNELSKALRKRTKFYEEKYGFRVLPEVFATNKYGANVGQTGKTTDYRQDDEQWWQKAKKDGLYVGDVEYDKSADAFSTDVGIRIDDNNGNFLGVIKVVLNIEEAINILKEAEAAAKYETTEFKLLTKDGKIIYTTEESEFLQPIPIELLPVLHHKADRHSHASHFIAAGDKPGEGDKLFAHAHSKGYRDYKGSGWILVVEHETEKIFAPVAKLKNDLLIISLTVTILAVLLGLSISRSIAKPLTKLKDAAATIGKGNLDTQIEISSNDEIGELAASFNDMAGKLKESYTKLKESHTKLKESHTKLEEKVKERTTALSSANVKLEGEIQQHTSVQKTLEERIKELKCLTGLSKLIEQPEISLEQIFQEMTGLIRSAYQYPDLTCVRITFEGIQYKTDNFKKTGLSQYAEIKVHTVKAGDIEVYYLGEKPKTSQSPFLKEEQNLLNAVAEHLGRTAERTQARDKLQLFRDLIDRSNDCIFIIEPKWGRFLDVNNRACDSLGYTREELLGMSVKDIEESLPDDSSWTEHVNEVREKGSMVLENQHKRKDGTAFPVEINVKFIEQEKDSYIVAVARDITERKKAEERLRHFQKAVDSSSDAIGMSTPQGRHYYQNEAFTKLFGLTVAEIDGVSGPPSTVYADGKVGREVFETIMRGDSWTGELEMLRKNGDKLDIFLRAYSIKDEKNRVIGLVGVHTDITERKQAEEKQAELLKEIESINKELKDFAYIVSHDLKAPLRGIKTLADWITTDYADKLDDDGKEQINLLSSRVDRMHNLIDGILQYSRVGRVTEKQVQVNLNELVPDIIDTIAPPENISITVENNLPIIECEQTRIIQVFQNLLSNAVKYMDKPECQIKIGSVEEDGFWKFSVADNGPGIEEKYFERIFQIFQTLSPRDEVESTGVGLSMVKKIVELYGGRIWVQSKPGEGSTFFFTMPKKEMGVKNAKLEEANIVG